VPLQVQLVSPERILYEGEADMVICRTIGGGDIAFLPGHAPFLGALDTWTLKLERPDGDADTAAVHGGFVSVRDDRVIVLSDIAEMESQIDVERARRAAEEAEATIAKSDDVDAEAALRRAHARLLAAGHEVS
jgi:F-type H+-transporting ATPase subunit epsilon